MPQNFASLRGLTSSSFRTITVVQAQTSFAAFIIKSNMRRESWWVTEGAVFDVAVDLRRSSPNFGHWYGVELNAENKKQLWVPAGFGHAFLVLSEPADFLYKTTDYYHPESERSILWSDSEIGIEWPLASGVEPRLSEKDASASALASAEVYD